MYMYALQAGIYQDNIYFILDTLLKKWQVPNSFGI